MIKPKWWFPFLPTVAFAQPPTGIPFDMRVLHVVGILAFTAVLLAVIQPWRTANRP